MFSGRKLFSYLFILIFIGFLFWKKSPTISEETSSPTEPSPRRERSSPPQRTSPYRKIAQPFESPAQPKLKFRIGSGPHSLGVSDENTLIGPGMLKKTDGGFLISDTFNNRILKVKENGDTDFEIPFSADSLLQGFAENKRGELWTLKREGSQLHLLQFDAQGREKSSRPIRAPSEFNSYVGTFRTFFSHGDFYVATSQKVLRVNSDGSTRTVPGVPLESQRGVYISARQDKSKKFIVDLKDENSKSLKSFYAAGDYQSLKNVYSDNQGKIHLAFENTFESKNAETGENVRTQAAIVETYDDQGKFIKDEMIEKSSDAEIDQDLDIDDEGNLNHLVLRDSTFELYSQVI